MADSTSKHSVDYMVSEAVAQRGDTYRTSDTIDLHDPNPSIFDCSKLTEWSAYQAGVNIPGTSYEQYLWMKEHGLLIPVDEAKHVKGALIFHFSSEPVPGGGRPDEAHVAFSLGDGTDIEAWGDDKGVNVFDMNDRFNYAALVPGLDYGPGVVSASGVNPATVTEADTETVDHADDTTPAAPDSAAAGSPADLTIDEVMDGLKMQESGGNYQATNPHETASGAYQYIDSTWADYGGYAHAKDAPAAVQDAKMKADLVADSDKLHDWERVIAAHFVGEGDATGPKSEWDVHPGPAENQNPSIREYVDSVLHHIEQDSGTTVPDPSQDASATASTTTSTGSAAAASAAAGYAMDPGRPAAASTLDSDHDGLTDAFERAIGTDPFNPDTDHDGLTDGYEVLHSHTDPLNPDTDHDGLTDGFEVSLGLDPNDPDSDHNGFTDSYEVQHGMIGAGHDAGH